jgi:16S rRNA processing protein RimM
VTGVTLSWRSSATSERLAVARIVGAKGLAGRVRVEPLTDRAERLAAGARVFLEGEAVARGILAAETAGRTPVLQLEGVADRGTAEALRGHYLEVDATSLPEGSYYWHQLVGLRVTDPHGAPLGSVTEVFRAGENEVYRIEDDAGHELLVPALRTVVLEIDVDAGRMVVDYQTEEVR